MSTTAETSVLNRAELHTRAGQATRTWVAGIRATGQDDRLDPELVEIVRAMVEPHAAELQASGVFGTPVPVDAGADAQTRLLAMLGRDNRR